MDAWKLVSCSATHYLLLNMSRSAKMYVELGMLTL